MRLPFATFKKIKLLIPKPASSSYTKERLKYHMLNNNEPPLRSPNAVISVTRRNQRRQETMHKVKMFRTAGLILLISLIAMSCGGSGSSESSNVIIGQGGQVVIDADAVKAAEDKQTGESNRQQKPFLLKTLTLRNLIPKQKRLKKTMALTSPLQTRTR